MPRLRSRVRDSSAAPVFTGETDRFPPYHIEIPGPFPRATHLRRGGRVVMQRPAKPCTPVRFRPPPPNSRVSRLSSSVLESRTAHGQKPTQPDPIADLFHADVLTGNTVLSMILCGAMQMHCVTVMVRYAGCETNFTSRSGPSRLYEGIVRYLRTMDSDPCLRCYKRPIPNNAGTSSVRREHLM